MYVVLYMYIQIKKDGDEILQGKSLGLEKLHAAVVGTNVEGMLHYCSNLIIFTYLLFRCTSSFT